MRCSCLLRCNAHRTIGYGPFSITARARQTPESQVMESGDKNDMADNNQKVTPTSSSASSPNLMRHVQLQTNLNLRLSLSNLENPSLVATLPYRSEPWRLAMCRLYRTILRLHNKTVAVSVDKARTESPQSAIAAETGISNVSSVEKNSNIGNCFQAEQEQKNKMTDKEENEKDCTSKECNSDNAQDVISYQTANNSSEYDDYMLRYLLNDEQRAFGNFFVHSEFTNHIDADALAASAFYSSWYDYVCSLASGITSRDLTEAERRELTDEQQERLRTLHTQLISLQNPFRSMQDSAEATTSSHNTHTE